MKWIKGLMATAFVMGAATAASAATFTMYDPTGAVNGVDTGVTLTSDVGASTWGVSSPNVFFGLHWTASGGTLYGPGTYTVDVNGDGADAPAGANLVTFTVPAGHIGGNIDFAWGATTGIDVFNVWDATGTSTDIDGDGTPGLGMVDGPFPGFSANFEPGPVVPEPMSMALVGSALVGLVGLRRKFQA